VQSIVLLALIDKALCTRLKDGQAYRKQTSYFTKKLVKVSLQLISDFLSLLSFT
jgi:hypothetical protein